MQIKTCLYLFIHPDFTKLPFAVQLVTAIFDYSGSLLQ